MNIQPIILFWLLVVTFIGIAFEIITGYKYLQGPVFFIGAGIIFFLLGVFLILLTLKKEENRDLKRYLLLTGGSAVGFFVGIIMHNLFYGLSIFVGDFKPLWYLTEILHGLFFVIAVIIMPLLFLAGVFGVILIKFRRQKDEKSR